MFKSNKKIFSFFAILIICNILILKYFDIQIIFSFKELIEDNKIIASLISITLIGIYIFLQGFFTPILIFIPLLFNFYNAIIVIQLSSLLGCYLVFKYYKIDNITTLVISRIDKISKKFKTTIIKNNNIFYFFLRFSGGFGLPNQLQILAAKFLNLKMGYFLLINSFSQLHFYFIYVYLVDQIKKNINIEEIQSINDIKIDSSIFSKLLIVYIIIIIIPILVNFFLKKKNYRTKKPL